MLTICTFKWGRRYGHEHVRNLLAMLKRNISPDFKWEFALITDQPKDMVLCSELGIRYIPLWQEMRNTNNCGVRLRAFGKDMLNVIGPRFAWIDLDMVIVSDITHIVSRREPLVGLRAPAPPLFMNGSFLMRDWDAYSAIYDEWDNAKYYEDCLNYDEEVGLKRVVSDEVYMSAHLHHYSVPLIGKEHGVYNFRRDLDRGAKKLPLDTTMVVMNGGGVDPARKELQAKCPWIREHWRH